MGINERELKDLQRATMPVIRDESFFTEIKSSSSSGSSNEGKREEKKAAAERSKFFEMQNTMKNEHEGQNYKPFLEPLRHMQTEDFFTDQNQQLEVAAP